VLVKGPAGMLLPGAVILGFLWMEGQLRRVKEFWSWPLAAVVIFLDLGWYSAAFFVGGEPFVMKQIVSENIDRFAGTGDFHAHHRSLTPLVWLATRLLPWNIVLLVALRRRLRSQREDSVGRFLHAWWSIIFMMFFLAAGQRAVYLLPIYPAVALLAARTFSRWLSSGNLRPTTPQSHRLRWAGLFPAMPKKLLAFLATAVVMNLAFAITTPIARWSQMKRSPDTPFRERTIALIPKGASVEADASFPDTDLMIIAYRLNRSIPQKVITCQGADYYLAMQSALPPCLTHQRPLASSGQGDESLVLMGPINHCNGSNSARLSPAHDPGAPPASRHYR